MDFGECKPSTSGCSLCAWKLNYPRMFPYGWNLNICSIRFVPMHLASFINFLNFLRNSDCSVLPLWINKNVLSTFRYLVKYLFWSWRLLSIAIQYRKYETILCEVLWSINFKNRRTNTVSLSSAEQRHKEFT